MELRQLSYFVTVAEELHFGRAAERLHIVQSAVSQQVRRLERELGCNLFDRSPRHVRLTGAGERLLPEAREVLAAAERARAAVRERTTLRLGTSAGLGEHLDRVLGAFAVIAPDTAVELVSAPTRDRLAQVADGRLDAAFVRAPQPAPGLRILPLWEDPLLVALPAAHPLATRDEMPAVDRGVRGSRPRAAQPPRRLPPGTRPRPRTAHRPGSGCRPHTRHRRTAPEGVLNLHGNPHGNPHDDLHGDPHKARDQ